MTVDDSAFWVAALMAVGIGGIFMWTDWRNRPSRALALCLGFMGLRLALAPLTYLPGDPGFWAYQIGCRVCETGAILAGQEWARRVAVDTSRMRRTVGVIFRVAQGIALLYGLSEIGYLLIAPGQAVLESQGLLRIQGLGWAFVPLLAVSMLLATIALIFVLITRRDPVESVRLRALMLASPFLLASLALARQWIPISVAIGLLIFLSGSVRYLIIQNQRGQSMRQFVPPEVARLLSAQGLEQAMRRERRVLSVVICDLRGFTAYARERDSEEVVGLLERYYQLVGSVAAECRGMVKDHAGDGVLILVGAPLRDRSHARHAVRLALQLSRRVSSFLAETKAPLGIGVGVATGPTTIGALRGAGRLEYAAVGTAVNLAARLCQRAADGEVLIDEQTHAALAPDTGERALAQAPETMKGFDTPVSVYALPVVPDYAERIA